VRRTRWCGAFFKILFTSAALAAVIASSLSSHASVSRMIYVMGRNGKGRIPRFLSYIHPTFLTPAHAVIIVGAVSLLAVKFTLEFISSMINFGALIAFTVVNLTVIVFYAIRLKQRRTPKEIITNIVLPFIGMCLTVFSGRICTSTPFCTALSGFRSASSCSST
jgi:putrescine importer